MTVPRYAGASWRPGPAAKTWGVRNSGQGVVLHSMQGGEAGAWSVLDDATTDARGEFRQPGSWHFSVMQDGRVFQHYDLDEAPFHAGSYAGNARYVGIEHEGGPPGNLGEPLTEAQRAASEALVRWIARTLGWTPRAGVTVFEHRMVTATLCPSGRIDLSRYEEDEVEVAKLVDSAAIAAVREIVQAVGQQQGEYVGRVTSGFPVPVGFTAYLVVSKDG